MNLFLKIELWKRYSKYLFSVLFLVVFIAGLFYVYFMNLAVIKTAERNVSLIKLVEVKRLFQEMETIYINKLEELNISYAESLGLIEAEPNEYIYRQKAVVQGNDYGQNFR